MSSSVFLCVNFISSLSHSSSRLWPLSFQSHFVFDHNRRLETNDKKEIEKKCKRKTYVIDNRRHARTSTACVFLRVLENKKIHTFFFSSLSLSHCISILFILLLFNSNSGWCCVFSHLIFHNILLFLFCFVAIYFVIDAQIERSQIETKRNCFSFFFHFFIDKNNSKEEEEMLRTCFLSQTNSVTISIQMYVLSSFENKRSE